MFMKKRALWRGLTTLFTFIFSLTIIIGVVAESYKATIDTALGTLSEKFVSENTEDDPLYDKFQPSAEVLNEDGTGNSHALIQKAIDLNRQQAAEGAVLLKNNNADGQGLPLAGNSQVTLFGIRSHVSLLGSSFGVKAQGPYISLEQALTQNKTDFKNTIAYTLNNNFATGEVTRGATLDSWSGDEFEFEGAGFTVNPVMTAIYDKLNETYLHSENETPSAEYDPGEPSAAEIKAVNSDYAASFAEYGDAAIVVISRPSAESKDYLPGGVVDGLGAEEPLQLTANERDTIEMAKKCSDNVIVLLNSANAVEIGDLKNDPEIDSILWIGFPGCYGMLGVSDILCGRTSPSGALPDIYATYNMSAPAMQNMGNFQYENGAEMLTRGAGQTGGTTGNYLIEAEGIYVGYRYYETRYYDSVFGNGNAGSPVGAYASSTEWDYDKEVAYGFGYGLSYTDFTQEFEGEPEFNVSTDPETGVCDATAVFHVKVTNTGDMAGKSIVQIYGQAPYTEGGVEKSAVQLLNFGKTDTLKPGESQVVSVEVDLQYIASYDNTYDNGDGTVGTYILDPGTYYFAMGNGAHDALNHMMARQGADPESLSGESNSAMAYEHKITEDFISSTAFSVSKTGEKISNQLDYADWNYFQPGEVTYLSRTDWAGTYPKSYTDMTLVNEELINLLNGNYYTIQTDDDTSGITWGKDSNLMFYEMYGTDFDDAKWQELLDKMTLEEAQYLATFGGPSIPGVSSIGTVETYMTENAGNGVAVNLNASKDTGAPWSISASDPNGNWHPEVFANAPLVAASFNQDLYKEVGSFIGEEALFTGIPILWGPGLNTHRHAYNGRNGEYYSEDPVLSGSAAMEFAIGALDYGLIAAPKHFAFNDQETNRSGVAPYMLEQRAREVELRAYQIAFEATKYDTEEEDAGMRGLMVSFSKIGPVECTASYELMTEILKEEWGFKGYAVTDIYDDTDIYGAVLASGTTCFDTRGISGFYGATTLENCSTFATQVDGSKVSAQLLSGDARLQNAVKDSCHNILYAFSQSSLMNRYNSTTHIEQTMTWWRMAYIAAIAAFGILLLASGALYVVSSKRKEREVS
ncbi:MULTISPECIES: glycoside hydrolase family 3 C-terminal domain-containing protein [Hungatella]|uniref:Beta-glucosidase n=1 Tax=Hungatella hathewayi TaxID=154046 RepID=A0A174JB61_9FIRM|nr:MULTISPECIES: glycoside hydrolase family 3 C-terminal domain-containing protein [Hungatella]CUO94370.1 beta-glucosidase [Hungatella hathewayi]